LGEERRTEQERIRNNGTVSVGQQTRTDAISGTKRHVCSAAERRVWTSTERTSIPLYQGELLGIFLDQTALALTKAYLARTAKHPEVLREADKLQRALPNSVSRNLRTPLASVLGVLNTKLQDGSLLDVPIRQNLLKTAHDDARQ